MVGIAPSEFWNMSPQEVYATMGGFMEFHAAEQEKAPMTRDRLDELLELYPDE